MAYDGSGSLFALGMRLTKLDATGAPLVGAQNSYVTSALVTAALGLEYEDGQEVIQRNGSGNICLAFQAPATLKRGTISDLSVCSPDPNVMAFTIGGDTITRAAVDESQTVTINGGPTGGTFTLTFEGDTTAPIAFDALAAAVQSALEGLDNLEPGDVTVTGAAGGPYSVLFADALGNVTQMTASGAGLTGGTSPTVTVATGAEGTSLTDIGYRAPQVGSDPTPNGISVELWTRAVMDGAYASELPYFHWVLARAFLRPSDAWTLSGEDVLLPSFEGFSNQNANWGSGPADDWPYPSDRVWQYARVASLPDLTPGFRAVA